MGLLSGEGRIYIVECLWGFGGFFFGVFSTVLGVHREIFWAALGCFGVFGGALRTFFDVLSCFYKKKRVHNTFFSVKTGRGGANVL